MGLKIDDVVPRLDQKLGEVLDAWRRIHGVYVKRVVDDCIWWTSERGNVGALATAAWDAGVCALEEYPDARIQRRHRVDLWLDLPSKSWGTIVEAKIHWAKIGRRTTPKSLASRVEEKVRAAKKQVKKLRARSDAKKPGAYRQMAVCFVVPCFTEGTDWNEPFRGFVEQMRKKLADGLVLAWHQAKQPLFDDKKKLLYPGVLLLGQLLPRT